MYYLCLYLKDTKRYELYVYIFHPCICRPRKLNISYFQSAAVNSVDQYAMLHESGLWLLWVGAGYSVKLKINNIEIYYTGHQYRTPKAPFTLLKLEDLYLLQTESNTNNLEISYKTDGTEKSMYKSFEFIELKPYLFLCS